MLMPKRTKFRKPHTAKAQKKTSGVTSNLTQLVFGDGGIQSLESGIIPAKTLEAVRRSVSRACKRSGQIWIRVFPDLCITQKPAEVRMGKGKGAPSYWACRVQKGAILFEFSGMAPELAAHAAYLAAQKLPVKTKYIFRY